MNIFRRKLKTNVKKKFVKKRIIYKSFKKFIIIVIKINNN